MKKLLLIIICMFSFNAYADIDNLKIYYVGEITIYKDLSMPYAGIYTRRDDGYEVIPLYNSSTCQGKIASLYSSVRNEFLETGMYFGVKYDDLELVYSEDKWSKTHIKASNERFIQYTKCMEYPIKDDLTPVNAEQKKY